MIHKCATINCLIHKAVKTIMRVSEKSQENDDASPFSLSRSLSLSLGLIYVQTVFFNSSFFFFLFLECFFRAIDLMRFYKSIVRDSLTVRSIGECELECIKTSKFTCRAFSYRYLKRKKWAELGFNVLLMSTCLIRFDSIWCHQLINEYNNLFYLLSDMVHWRAAVSSTIVNCLIGQSVIWTQIDI